MMLSEIMRPELAAGGFSRSDSTFTFYMRVNLLSHADMTVVDFGAGRGASFDPSLKWCREYRSLRGKVKEVIGIDVDEAVNSNETLDSFRVLSPDSPLPFDNETIDMIISDWTFEHITNVNYVASEISRILKPGGWICARTPSKFSLISILASIIPNKLHKKLLKFAQPSRRSEDIFPTAYKLNTLSDLTRYFPNSKWKNYSYYWRSDPAYHFESRLLWRTSEFLGHLLPPFMYGTLVVFLNKR